MYEKPMIITMKKNEMMDLMVANASCVNSYCSQGAIYCGSSDGYSSTCPSGSTYCSGGSYVGS